MILFRHIFLFFTLCSATFGSFSWESSEAQNEIDESIVHLYNYDFDSSLLHLNEAELIDPNHPLIPFLRTSASWLKVQTEVGFEESYDQIRESFELSIPKYKNLITKYPDNPEYYLYMGSLYGLLARIELAYGHWFKVLVPTMKGYSYVSTANEMNADLYDTYTPIGMSNYYTCMSQPFVHFCSNLAGIKFDCNLSLDYLELASEKSYYSWVEANNILAYIYIYAEKDYEKALSKIEPLMQTFPKHPYFPFLKAAAIVRMESWEEYHNLRPVLENLALNQPSQIVRNECMQKLEFLDAYKLFYTKEYLATISKTTQIIDNYSMEFDWLLGLSYHLRGKSFMELGMIEYALIDFKKVSSMSFKFPEINEAKDLYLLLKTENRIQ